LQRISTGSGTSGNTTVQFEDNLGNILDINFFRPAPQTINVEVNIENLNDSTFPDNGVALIQQAIVDYSIGGAPALGITEGFDIDGFPPGQDILLSRLFTPINSVPGHKITNLQLAIDPAPVAPSDVTIGFNEVGSFSIANILVVVS